MRDIVLFFLIVTFAAGLYAQTPAYTDERVLKAVARGAETGEEITSTEYFRTASPEAAWSAFEYLSRNAEYYGKVELAKQAGRVIAENPGIEKYVTKGMAKLPHDYDNMNERGSYLLPLGYVAAPWSLRLLAHYLNDETPMVMPKPQPDYPSAENSDYAVVGLQRMGFSDAPPKSRYGVTPEVTQAWRKWWKENEGRAEQRIREINPGYYPPQPAAAATTPVSTPKPTVAGEYASTPAVGNTPKPTPAPSVTPVAAAPAKQSDWAVYAIGGLVAIAALVAMGWAMRRRNVNSED